MLIHLQVRKITHYALCMRVVRKLKTKTLASRHICWYRKIYVDGEEL